MKTKYLLFGLVTLLAAGCVNEEFAPAPSTDDVRVFANMASTRVIFDEGDAVTYATWQNGDVISLSTDMQSNLQYIADVSEEGGNVTEFRPNGDALQNIYKTVVYACYPSAMIDMVNMTVPLPNTQNYDQSGFHPFVYAIDTLMDGRLGLHFHHPYAYLKLTFKEGILPSDTTSLGTVMIASDEVIAAVNGKFNFSTRAVEVTEGSKTMLIERLKDDGTIPVLKDSAYTIYVPILPQKEGAKITIKVCHAVGSGLENYSPFYENEKHVPVGGFQAGHVYTLTMNDLNEPIERIPGIYSLQDLLDFRDARKAHADLSKWATPDSVINLYADIDMASVTDWQGMEWLHSNEVFEGNLHTISNLRVNVASENYGFFRTNMGIIRNLTLRGEITVSGDNLQAAAFSVSNAGVIYNCHNYMNGNSTGRDTYLGGLSIAIQESGKIDNCYNYGNLKATCVSGFGSVYDNSKITNCSNHGTIESNGNATEGVYVGAAGIALSNASVISDCVNTGRILGNDSVFIFTGGICNTVGAGAQIINCENKGEVASAGYTGGIVSTIQRADVLVSKCVNSGSVSAWGMAGGYAGGICGLAHSTNAIFTDNVNSGAVVADDVAGGICGVANGTEAFNNNTNSGTVNGLAGTEANSIGRDGRNP